MGREELLALVRQGPVRVQMNDGSVYEVPSSESCVVGDLHATVLVRDDEERLRNITLARVCMCSAEPYEAA